MGPLDLDITFIRGYLTHHFGIAFDERFFTDWRHRVQTDMAVQRALAERFGDIGLGNPDPQPRVRLGFDDTLNLALMFGPPWEVQGGISWIRPGFLGTPESVESLTVPEVESTWPTTLLAQQYDEAVAELGVENVVPPRPKGVLEAALDLRGDQLLTDFYEAPALAEKLFGIMAEAISRFQEFWLRKRGGRPWEDIALGGCSATMLSPKIFEQFILPHYQRITQRFGGGFLCACGLVTHLLESFAKMEHCRYFRLGWGTDLRRARLLLGKKHIKASLDPARVAKQTPAEVKRDVAQMVEACGDEGPLSILLIHVGADMPDENLRALYEAVAELGGRLSAAPRSP